MRRTVPIRVNTGAELGECRAEGIFCRLQGVAGSGGRRFAAAIFIEARKKMKRARYEARGRVVSEVSRFGRAARKTKFLKLIWAQCLLVFALGVFGAAPAWSQTQVTSITASPDIVQCVHRGVDDVHGVGHAGRDAARRSRADGGSQPDDPNRARARRRERRARTASCGTGARTATRSRLAGNHAVRVFNRATTTYLGPISSVTVQGIPVQRPVRTFTPTGFNTVDFTIQATPGQTGLTLRMFTRVSGSTVYWYGPGCSSYLPLTETSPGVVHGCSGTR